MDLLIPSTSVSSYYTNIETREMELINKTRTGTDLLKGQRLQGDVYVGLFFQKEQRTLSLFFSPSRYRYSEFS